MLLVLFQEKKRKNYVFSPEGLAQPTMSILLGGTSSPEFEPKISHFCI